MHQRDRTTDKPHGLPMDQADQNKDKPPLWMGFLAAGVGLYFVLVGVGVLPIPGGPRNLHGPLWVVVCAGLAFLLGGLALLLQAAGGADHNGEFPASAPAWMKAAQHLFGIAIGVSFAATATWIAFGAGQRSFDMTGGFLFGKSAGEIIGRTAFGIGAVICWLYTFAMINKARKKLLGGGKS